MFVYTTRAPGCVTFEFGALSRANFAYRIFDEGLQLFRICVSIARLYVLSSATKNVGANHLLDEF
jgi:hypothetical protein